MNLSIIVPIYNAASYLNQCIDSLLDQDIHKNDYEIILINDGSTDNSAIIARQYETDHENITVFEQNNQGLSKTRNRGIQLAKGQYVFFVDSDDYIANNTLKELVEAALKSNLDVLEFKIIRTESRNLKSAISRDDSEKKITAKTGKEYISSRSFNDSACVYLYNKEFLLRSKVLFIEGRVMEDMIFNAELISKATKIAYYPLDIYRYVINPNSIWTSREPNAFRKSIYDFIFMTKEYATLTNTLKHNGYDTAILESKKQNMLYNISKRLLQSDFKQSEIANILKDLSEQKLRPMILEKKNELSRKLVTTAFNNRYAFLFCTFSYKLLKEPIQRFVIKKHQRNKEQSISAS